MNIFIESNLLCGLFTLMVFIMSRKPINTLYNYPPKIQERVKSLEEYKDSIPANKNKIAAKFIACIMFVVILSLILRFISRALSAVNSHILIPVFFLLSEHKHYVVIAEQSEVIQVNANIESERLPQSAVSVRVAE